MAYGDRFLEQVRLTREAIERGDDVIYQAAFFDGTWRGHADFLLRVPGHSALGDYHYEVADTKLARATKAGALLQLCTYVDLLEQIQGIQGESIHVALGGSAKPVETHRVADVIAYYRALKRRFEATVNSTIGQWTTRRRPARLIRSSTVMSAAGSLSALAGGASTTARHWWQASRETNAAGLKNAGSKRGAE